MAESNAGAIVDSVGGPSNIQSLTHCATRLRFQLVDGSVVDTAKVEAVPGVMGGVPQSGDRYQVVIGGAVTTVSIPLSCTMCPISFWPSRKLIGTTLLPASSVP